MARRRSKGLDIHGIFLLNKPLGMSSNAALQRVKRLFNANKAGHTGSLDPLATGLLPICLGEATKVSSYLLDSEKAYTAVAKLGSTTTTGDAEGEIVKELPLPEDISLELVQQVFQQYTGDILQVPPMYSALKQQGVPLYKLARAGKEVERAARPVTIYELRLLGWQGERLEISVRCSKGTYIRTLAEDIGNALGCGAHLTSLHRTSVGRIGGEQMMTLEALEKLQEEQPESLLDHLVDVDLALTDWPAIHLSEEQSDYFRQGRAIEVAGVAIDGLIRAYDVNNTLLAIAKMTDDGKITPKRLFHLA